MISVLMSTNNGSKTIDYSIVSILNQTYSNFKFIICDDGSTDNTWKHLLYWSKRDKRIVLIRNHINKGLQISLNRCIEHSGSSEYIARMDDDDISLPNRFKIQVQFLKHNNVAFVGSSAYLIDNYNKVYGEHKLIKFPSSKQLMKKDRFYHPSIMIRSNILKHVNGYSDRTKHYRVEDYELWLRLYSLGYRGANVINPLIKYRMNLKDNRFKFRNYFNQYRLLFDYRTKMKIGPIKYYYIFLSFIKIFIPPILRNLIHLIDFSRK